jgi:hypothetical protein
MNNTSAGLNIPDSYYVGGAIGYAYFYDHTTVIIKNQTLTGPIVSRGDAGGVIGYADAEVESTITISNTTIDQDISGTDGYVGGIIGQGYLYGTDETTISITNVTVSGDMSGQLYIGGLMGYASIDNGVEEYHAINSTVSGNTLGSDGAIGGHYGYAQNLLAVGLIATGNVDGYSYTGGVVGYGQGIHLTQSSASGAVASTLGDHSGGLVGYAEGGSEISESYATGNVSGDEAIGGLVGGLYSGTITNSYARGTSTGTGLIGSLVGYCNATIEKSYATGAVSGSADVGGLIGLDGGSCTGTDSFWDTQTTGQNASSVGTGKTTAALKIQDTYTNTAGSPGLTNAWNFSGTWGMVLGANDGYPCLSWASSCAAADVDDDGILTTIENAAPNSGDANNDGDPDSAQGNVASFVNAITSQYTTIALDVACGVTSATAQTEAAQATQDAGYNYQSGLISFSANCGTPGYTMTVRIYTFGTTTSGLVLRKYNPTTHAYFTVPGATLSQQTIGGQTATVATYQITDGSALDADGLVNGTIIDPVGLALGAVGVPSTGIGGRY